MKLVNYKMFNQYFQKEDSPIHRVVRLMTMVHRSDYFRPYILNHYGGGYADIKHLHFDWKPYFEKLYSNPLKWALGYPEISPWHVPCNN